MKQKQRGMTLISWILVLLVALLFGIAALRLVPVYLEYLKITSSLSSVQREYNGQTVSQNELRTALAKRFDIESVHVITKNDVKIERQGGGYQLRAAYEQRAPFIANVAFVVSFDKSVQIASH
jgi:Domain of unknown function (DUF4845)